MLCNETLFVVMRIVKPPSVPVHQKRLGEADNYLSYSVMALITSARGRESRRLHTRRVVW